jgi:tetratricopeptide (TPR) repeat protein
MIRPLTFALAPWRSGGWDGNQEQEADCAISDYTNALESDRNNATAYLGRGTAHLEVFDFDSAIADFTKAIELMMPPPTPTGLVPTMKKVSSTAP